MNSVDAIKLLFFLFPLLSRYRREGKPEMGLWRRGAGVFPDFRLHLSEIVDQSGYLSLDLEAKIEGNLPEK